MILIPALVSILVSAADPFPVPAELDSSRVRPLLASVAPDSVMPRTADWTFVGPVGDSAVLLADGTEWMRLPWGLVRDLASADVPASHAATRPLGELLMDWGAPPAGGRIWLAMDNARGARSTSLLEWSANVAYRHAIGRYLSVGGGVSWEQFLFSPDVARLTRDSSHPSGVGVLASVCGPFVCGELARRVSPVEQESWLQPDLDSLLQPQAEGKRFWVAGRSSSYDPAWERRLVVHAGAFAYRAGWCPKLWDGAFQSVGFWDLPAGVFRFGFGMEWTSDRASARGELSIAPVSRVFRSSDPEGFRLEFAPLDFSIAFRRMDEFQLAFRTGLRFPDPFSNHPSRTSR